MQFERPRKCTAGNNKQENAANEVGKVFHCAPIRQVHCCLPRFAIGSARSRKGEKRRAETFMQSTLINARRMPNLYTQNQSHMR